MKLSAPLLIASAFWGCTAEILAQPGTSQVKSLIDASYRAPERHTVVARPAEGRRPADMVRWARQFDGVEMLNDARTVLVDGQKWETRWLRELSEPEPVRRAEL